MCGHTHATASTELQQRGRRSGEILCSCTTHTLRFPPPGQDKWELQPGRVCEAQTPGKEPVQQTQSTDLISVPSQTPPCPLPPAQSSLAAHLSVRLPKNGTVCSGPASYSRDKPVLETELARMEMAGDFQPLRLFAQEQGNDFQAIFYWKVPCSPPGSTNA